MDAKRFQNYSCGAVEECCIWLVRCDVIWDSIPWCAPHFFIQSIYSALNKDQGKGKAQINIWSSG